MALSFRRFAFIPLYLFHAAIFAASFDCNKAKGYTEITICITPEISDLDEKLSAVYKEVNRANPANAELVKQSQLLWMKNIRNKATNAQDLKFTYVSRINDLEMMLGKDVKSIQSKDQKKNQEIDAGAESKSMPARSKEQQKEKSYPENKISQEHIQSVKDNLNNSINRVGNNLGSLSYYCNRNNRNSKNEGALKGAISKAMESNLLTSEGANHAEHLESQFLRYNNSLPPDLASVYIGYYNDMQKRCNSLANMARSKGWALW